MTKEQTYQITDLGCAGAVISAGANLIKLERVGGKRVFFVFEYSYELEQMINNYWKSNLQIDARTYFENVSMLKTRIFSEQ